MIGLHTSVLAGATSEPGRVIARVRDALGRLTYSVRFADGRVRAFEARWVRVAVVTGTRLRLVVDNGARA